MSKDIMITKAMVTPKNVTVRQTVQIVVYVSEYIEEQPAKRLPIRLPKNNTTM